MLNSAYDVVVDCVLAAFNVADCDGGNDDVNAASCCFFDVVINAALYCC